MNGFKHEVLGDVSDETRWLKFFTTKDLLRIVAGGGICLVMIRTVPQTGFFILIEACVVVYTLLRVALGMIPRSKSKYLKGGGVSYYNLLMRKIKRKKIVYTLGIEEVK